MQPSTIKEAVQTPFHQQRQNNMSERKQQLLHTLQLLQRKEEELALMIQAVDANFRELGYKVDSTVDVTKKAVPVQTGIRMKGLLSFRGKEKAAEYFDVIDVDKDGFLNYEDFRGVRGFRDHLGFVNAPEVQSSEAWRMYMADCGLPASEQGGITRDQYTRYREIIESQQPLSTELDYLKLGYLPPRQKQWNYIKFLLKEHMDFRTSRLPPGTYANMVAAAAAALNKSRASSAKHRNKDGAETKKPVAVEEPLILPGMQDETFTIEEISYIVANADINIVLTKPEIALLMLDRCRRKRLLEQLIFKYSKRNLSQQDFPFQLNPEDGRLALQFKDHAMKVTSDDIKSVQKKELVPWLLGLPSTLFDHTELYRKLIEWKNKFIRNIRTLEDVTRNMFHFAAHLNDRLVFRDFGPFQRLSKALQEVSTIKFGVNIGDETRREGGISGSFKMVKLDTPSAYFKTLKVASDSGTMIMLDWLFHADTTEEQGARCAVAVRQFLGHHLEKELRGNKMFGGMSVSTALNEADDAKVLRVIFSFKRIVSLDGWLEHMLVPYMVTDLVSVLVGDFRTNLDLGEIIKSRVTSLSETFAASFDCTIGIRRNLIIQLLERLELVVSAGVTPEQADVKEAPPVDVSPTKKTFKKAAAKPSTTNADGTSTDGKSAAPNSILAEENERRLDRWRFIHPFFPFVRQSVSFVLSALRCMKNASFRFKFNDIGDCIHKIGILDLSFGRWMNRGWTHKPGYIREMFNKMAALYSKQFGALHHSLKTFLEHKKLDDDARRKRELMTQQRDEEDKAKQADKASTLEKLKRLGIDTHGSDLFHVDSSDPLEYIRNLSDEIAKQDVQNLIAVENLRAHVIGLHSCEIISGKSKLSVLVQGFDIFDILPQLPNMQSVQEVNSLRPAKAVRKT